MVFLLIKFTKMENDQEVMIQDLYPELSPKQQEEAEQNLLGYLDVVCRIYERIEAEGRLDELGEILRREKQLGKQRNDLNKRTA